MTEAETARALLQQAVRELAVGDVDGAEKSLLELQKTGKCEDAVQHNLGVVASLRGRHSEAAAFFERALELDPGDTEARVNLSSVYLDMDRNDDAASCCDSALALNPNDAKAHYNRSLALRRLRRFDEALPAAIRAVELDAGDAFFVAGLARLLDDLGRLPEALAWYDRTLALDPRDLDIRYNRALVLLKIGDFAHGLPDYELRWHFGGKPERLTELSKPRWVGQVMLEGKTILMQVEQGLGDNIQFARYASLLAARGAKVILRVWPALLPLFQGFPDTVAVVSMNEPTDKIPPFDMFVPMMSLPLILETRVDTIPATPRYLQAPRDRAERWRSRLGERARPRIGIVWSGNERHLNDLARSMPLASFPIPNPGLFDVFSLQKVVRPSDQPLLDSMAITQFSDQLDDMADTAAVAELMDVVITVDTAVAHLAAALGRPVWLLLPSSGDWRWLHGRTDSPWYPTMRIFRQPKPDDWQTVFDQVTAALAEVLHSKVADGDTGRHHR
jgi:Flp pilus assembly protein TadD